MTRPKIEPDFYLPYPRSWESGEGKLPEWGLHYEFYILKDKDFVSVTKRMELGHSDKTKKEEFSKILGMVFNRRKIKNGLIGSVLLRKNSSVETVAHELLHTIQGWSNITKDTNSEHQAYLFECLFTLFYKFSKLPKRWYKLK